VTYEELARLALGELDAERARAIEGHLDSCAACRRRLRALESADAALRALPRMEPPAGAVLNTRRLLSRRVRGADAPEIMTLDEVAEFLRISLDELEEVVLELPVFELAGQLRVRRSKLTEWIEERERAFARGSAQSEAARILAGAP
jgi:transcriptional regulator with XRE-family HTH domain